MAFIRDYLQKIEKRIKGPRLFIQVLPTNKATDCQN